MKKHVLLTAVFSLVSNQVFAQPAMLDSEIDATIDQKYAAPKGSPVAANIAPAGNTSGQPIYILNQATPTSTAQAQAMQVQKQPTTYIEASPLTKSRADQIREARQQVEAETESRIVEKLEQSRMEDEKRRASVLFGDSFNQMGPQQQQPQAQPVQAQPVYVAPTPVVVTPAPAPTPVVVAPAPVPTPAPVVVEPQEDTREVVRSEIRMALDEEKKAKPEASTERYFSAIAGMGDYPDVMNVRGNYLLGASFGTKFEDTYAVEGSFIYSNYTVQKLDSAPYYAQDQFGNWIAVPPLVDVAQYGGSIAVKYYLLSGLVRPIVGGLAQYSYRQFSWSSENYGSYSNAGGSDATSHAIDLGVLTGADFEFNEKFTLGLDFRYMFNMSSRVNMGKNAYFLQTPTYGTPIERLQYYNLSLVARVAF